MYPQVLDADAEMLFAAFAGDIVTNTRTIAGIARPIIFRLLGKKNREIQHACDGGDYAVELPC
ncbi:MAG: hypothetical protein HYR84_05630 [Planctomycetes bacterium]|nr:hypothetical protein [Planctomycetota bacterium]